MKLALASAAALLLQGCTNAQLLSDRVTILDGEAGRHLLNQCSRAAPEPDGPFFRPGVADVRQLETHLTALLHDVKEDYPRTPEIAEPFEFTREPDRFARQYVGITLHGRRIIYGNIAYGEDFGGSAPSIVCDGGPQFFGVEYDIEREDILRVDFNGGLGGPPYDPIMRP